MNKFPLTKKQIIKLFKKQKSLVVKTELINLQNSQGRFLYEDLKSKINIPPFNNSAVDGYALLKKDLNKKNLFYCHRKISAGSKKNFRIKSGEAIRVFTGAKMPLNSSTIVMQENTIQKNNKITISKFPKLGENYRLKGEDIKKKQKILFKGSQINKQNINLIAAAGIKKVKVFKKIKISFFTSGNELRQPTKNLKKSEINNSNFFALNSLLNQGYISKKYLGNLKDDLKIVKNKIFKASKNNNIIITSGGASVGDEDHLINALLDLGNVFFWKAAIKPGKPIAVGKLNNCYVICLPGNPVSVQLLFVMLINPLIRKLSGGNFNLPKSSKIVSHFNMKKNTRRMEWLRIIKKTLNNQNIAIKYPKQGSGMISSVSYSDGIIEIDEEITQIKKGDIFDFYDFENLF